MKRLVLVMALVAAAAGCASGTAPFDDSNGIYAAQDR